MGSMSSSALTTMPTTRTVSIEAEVPGGVPEHVVRTVTENRRTLQFETQGFEREEEGDRCGIARRGKVEAARGVAKGTAAVRGNGTCSTCAPWKVRFPSGPGRSTKRRTATFERSADPPSKLVAVVCGAATATSPPVPPFDAPCLSAGYLLIAGERARASLDAALVIAPPRN